MGVALGGVKGWKDSGEAAETCEEELKLEACTEERTRERVNF